MAEAENFIEMGDFLVEFNQTYLGCGKTSLALTLKGSSIRRDEFAPSQYRKIDSCQWSIRLALGSAERIWQMIAEDEKCTQKNFQRELFTQGAKLKLYPVSPLRQGYEFKRVYLESVSEESGDGVAPAEALIRFAAESAADDTTFFTRMGAGARPESAPEKVVPDSDAVSRELLQLFRQYLDITEDQLLELNFFEGSANAYKLQLQACQNWEKQHPHNLVYTLTSRFLLKDKQAAEQKVFDSAVRLHGHTLSCAAPLAAICRVQDLQFGNIKIINGRSMVENVLTFSVLIN